MKKKSYILLPTIIVILLTLLVIPTVKADSGFDSSFDTGGGWSGGSSWGSGSSWDSGSNYYSSSSSNDDTSINGAVLILAIVILIVPTLIAIETARGKQNKSSNILSNMKKLDHRKELSIDKIKALIPDYNAQEFLQARYQDYIDIQHAWMNFEYEKLRTKLTDELYNQYEMQLQTLKIKNEQNVMESFNYLDSMITDIKEENNQITVTMELKVAFYDYIVQNHQVTRGNKHRKIYMHYELIYVCNKTTPDTCPNCGAKLTSKASQTCEYCGSTIVKVSKDWVLSKKEAKDQQ